MNRTWRIVLGIVLLSCASIGSAQTTSTSTTYSFQDRGGMTFSTTGGASAVAVGYARVDPGGGTTAPAGVAIFGYRVNGVLVTEAGVPAMQAVLSGRTYAEVNGPINTGIAFANPNGATVTISYYFTDQNGNTSNSGSFMLNAGAQMAKFISEAPFSVTGTFAGTLTFNASAPVGVIALRGFTNQRGEFLITTQTIASISGSSSAPLVMAHFADGGGWQTQVLLVNSSDALISGTVQFFGEGSGNVAATPVTLTVNGQVGITFSYAIPAHASVKLQTSGLGTTTQVGSVVVTPASGSNAPSGFTLFSFTSNGVTVTQASVAGQPGGSIFRMYIESSGAAGTLGSIDSGIAITNTSTTAATVNLDLTTLDGARTGLTASITVPASGHVAKFVHELFPGLTPPFRGVVRINANASQIVVVGLRTRYNERGDFLITTTPASNELSSGVAGDVLFPHIVNMGGYTTQFVLFSGSQNQSGIGTVSFFDQTGAAMNLSYQ